MTKSTNLNDGSWPRRVSRRELLKIAAAGLLAGCRPAPLQPAEPTEPAQLGTTEEAPAATTPAATSDPPPVATDIPTSTPTLTPIPKPSATPRQVEAITLYPDGPSRVVHTHAGAWEIEELVTEVLDEMLDVSITRLTGLNDGAEAWAALFSPEERVAIKVNTIAGSKFFTRVPLVLAVVDRLKEVGIPPEQIIIFDRYTLELERCDFTVNKDGPGVRCYGTDFKFTTGWSLMDIDIGLSDILLSCDALINMPVIKQHGISGISFAMKNHYGTFDIPGTFHEGRIGRAIAELNALSPIKDRTRLIIGDALEVSTRSWYTGVRGDSILMAFDPVAHDTVGLQLYENVMTSEGLSAVGAISLANQWLENGAELEVGTNDPDNMEVIEVLLG